MKFTEDPVFTKTVTLELLLGDFMVALNKNKMNSISLIVDIWN